MYARAGWDVGLAELTCNTCQQVQKPGLVTATGGHFYYAVASVGVGENQAYRGLGKGRFA